MRKLSCRRCAPGQPATPLTSHRRALRDVICARVCAQSSAQQQPSSDFQAAGSQDFNFGDSGDAHQQQMQHMPHHMQNPYYAPGGFQGGWGMPGMDPEDLANEEFEGAGRLAQPEPAPHDSSATHAALVLCRPAALFASPHPTSCPPRACLCRRWDAHAAANA